jgi:hypothetical protein
MRMQLKYNMQTIRKDEKLMERIAKISRTVAAL